MEQGAILGTIGLFCVLIIILIVSFMGGEENTYITIAQNATYGEMYYHNHTGTTLNFAVDSFYYTLWFTEAEHLSGFTFNAGNPYNSNLTVDVGGLYLVNWQASGSGQNNHEYYTTVFVNETDFEECETHHKMSTGGDIITQHGTCTLNLTVGDRVTVRTADIGDTGDGVYYSGGLYITSIH